MPPSRTPGVGRADQTQGRTGWSAQHAGKDAGEHRGDTGVIPCSRNVAEVGRLASGVSAARDIAAAIPGARLCYVPGVGHFPARAVWATYADELRALADQALALT
jgi:hypothetical protein